ncbi:hypothetical protein H5410_028686 [Solanum commersonii]|uniref:Uncharacterized protein n=1 Tax=Solanum commersonii TaxID=4109 RepID=A0A9J5Z3D4_SOLCO|nr:hypothetical protein H5410_028686 [Solanum commersonii]
MRPKVGVNIIHVFKIGKENHSGSVIDAATAESLSSMIASLSGQDFLICVFAHLELLFPGLQGNIRPGVKWMARLLKIQISARGNLTFSDVYRTIGIANRLNYKGLIKSKSSLVWFLSFLELKPEQNNLLSIIPTS